MNARESWPPVSPSGIDVPPEIARYAGSPPQLGVGQPGKAGVLQVEVGLSGGATCVLRSFHRAPLRVLRALYCEPARPDLAFLYLMSTSGGVLQGDRLSVDVLAREGSRVHVTTQAMAKLYGMRCGYATQQVRLRAEPGSYIEYLPDPIIPYRGARYYQEVLLEKAPGATLISADILLPGRVAAGEAFAYDVLGMTTRGRDLEGRLRFQDVMLLEPARMGLQAPGCLGGFSVVGSLFVLTDAVPVAKLLDAVSESLLPGTDSVLGASALPNGCGVVARVLSRCSRGAQESISTVWATARRLLLGEGLPELRKY